MDEVDRVIVSQLQAGFPLAERPFAEAGAALGIDEAELIRRIGALLEDGVLTRFGPMFNADAIGGAFTLAAISVPSGDFERVAQLVNAHPEVAHNYERDHELNMWFVVATETRAEIARVIARIEAETGYAVRNFPKEREYFVGLHLAVQ